ncbi:M1 family metallopeptidase [Agriterribacter sp.]|uniref:M1 family metallopeptidase n=1 Tax=Agriterribacter sp. TaxID=2821509 RepID=UPI002CAC9EB6|nr:M1 family metallopeptidase [Agriterribacter sp.]HRO47527.1 M1 family metallopeptidase [Agriterribacter sp.]HRQ17015.1 M1 family metallopeptidase [Agriterribacter sp.]
MQKIRYSFFLFLFLFHFFAGTAQPLHQKQEFTHADTLRGTITPERAWWDVTHYDLQVNFDFNKRSIAGYNIISYTIVSDPVKEMQIDLQLGLDIDSVVYENKNLSFRRNGNAYFVAVPAAADKAKTQKIAVYYHGIPRPALHPPWDGGIIWSKDQEGNPWITVACQGLGASVWYPCKDHQSDEPDSASLSMIVPDTLTAIANGRLRNQIKNGDGTATYTWVVTNPINSYNIIPYIGKYAHWHEDYDGEKGKLDCDFWVMAYNIEKAKVQFKQALQMLRCFEYWFGPYPFYEDGYKLIEAPHLGMEHQSAVAYGNGFANGYKGTDLSGTGWGLKWDFIIVHESGHEWFGNNITTKDVADMWVHEGFTNYSETIFTDCTYGTEAGNDYVIGTRKKIQNDKPVEGPYGVNQEGSGDMYYKGGNLVHMIRQIINNDSSFRMLLRGMNQAFYHQTVTGKQIEEYISKTSGIDFSKVFDQYVRTTQVPVLEYKVSSNKLSYRWSNCVKGFNMPLKINFGGERWISPGEKWKTLKIKQGGTAVFSTDRNFYIRTKQL